MLILTHRIDESIIMTLPDGQIINVMITDVIDGKVRIGIDASEDIKIFRDELIINE